MKIREVMTPAPVSVASVESVSEVAKAMREHGIGSVLVVTGGKLTGLITDRDITVRVLAEGQDPEATRSGDACTGDLVTLGPDDDTDKAVRLIRERAVRRIPVVENGAPVGMVSIGDLAVMLGEHFGARGGLRRSAAQSDLC
jgi:CBS domain-containing protein